MDARTSRSPKIALVANTSWYLHNFRTRLMYALREMGCEVLAVAPEDEYSRKLIAAGFSHRHIPLDATGVNPVPELQSILSLRRLLYAERIQTVLSFTPKGNVHCGLAIAGSNIAFVPNISGLGRGFSEESGLRWAAKATFKLALRRATTVFFQNDDDMRMLVSMRIVDAAKALRIPGSGVDLRRFSHQNSDAPRDSESLIFLFIARLLWEKGLGQYAAAAKNVRARLPHARFQVLGRLQKGAGGVPKVKIDGWVDEGAIEFLGETDDVRRYIDAADCIVLPSYYREGVPRSLLEAAAMAKPVISCDVAGCRDAVTHNATGYLCRPRDVEDLTVALEKFIGLSALERKAMGLRGRAKMETEFDEMLVINQYLDVVSQIAF